MSIKAPRRERAVRHNYLIKQCHPGTPVVSDLASIEQRQSQPRSLSRFPSGELQPVSPLTPCNIHFIQLALFMSCDTLRLHGYSTGVLNDLPSRRCECCTRAWDDPHTSLSRGLAPLTPASVSVLLSCALWFCPLLLVALALTCPRVIGSLPRSLSTNFMSTSHRSCRVLSPFLQPLHCHPPLNLALYT